MSGAGREQGQIAELGAPVAFAKGMDCVQLGEKMRGPARNWLRTGRAKNSRRAPERTASAFRCRYARDSRTCCRLWRCARGVASPPKQVRPETSDDGSRGNGRSRVARAAVAPRYATAFIHHAPLARRREPADNGAPAFGGAQAFAIKAVHHLAHLGRERDALDGADLREPRTPQREGSRLVAVAPAGLGAGRFEHIGNLAWAAGKRRFQSFMADLGIEP
jgi:hypothetical protein